MRIGHVTPVSITDLWSKVERPVRNARDLEEAAQTLAEAVHADFDDSVVLARIFVTLPFSALPAESQRFVRDLAGSAGGEAGLNETTPVLSLVGTHGQQSDWNDRRRSQGHVGIPLVSSAFVGGIPMISRLLKEIGVPLEWVDSGDARMIQKTLGKAESLFYVEEASQATDDLGRKIIAAQDFVSRHRVRSVFGIGGAYPGGEIVVLIVFSSEHFDPARAESFLPLVSLFKASTAQLVGDRKLFH